MACRHLFSQGVTAIVDVKVKDLDAKSCRKKNPIRRFFAPLRWRSDGSMLRSAERNGRALPLSLCLEMVWLEAKREI